MRCNIKICSKLHSAIQAEVYSEITGIVSRLFQGRGEFIKCNMIIMTQLETTNAFYYYIMRLLALSNQDENFMLYYFI